MGFFDDIDLRPIPIVEEYGLEPIGLAIGQGPQALEIIIARGNSEPTANTLKDLWKKRRSNRATPVVCVVIYGDKAALIGPSGEEPPIYKDLDPSHIERLCSKALVEPDRHMAEQFIKDQLPDLQTEIPGLRNEGLFATHELTYGVPKREDWGLAINKARDVLGESGKSIIRALGYEILQTTGPISILQHEGRKSALALFLDHRRH
jgi:hypothetical protein